MKQIKNLRWLLVLALPLLPLLPGRAQNAPQLDVPYGDDPEQKLDIYLPPNPQAKSPAILFVHGGGWSGGNKRDFGTLAVGAANNGFVGISVGYRLAKADKNKYPAQLDDVQRAVRWIRANADKYGVDPQRIGAFGASAGGHLVTFLGTRDTRDNSDAALAKYSSRVQAVVDLFGPSDLASQKPVSDLAKNIVINFIGKTPEQAPEVYKDASPLLFVDKTSAPTLIFHGTADALVPLDQSQVLYDALQKAGVESELVKFEGEGHGFRKPENNATLLQKTLAFFSKHLKKAQ
jgi:acetyl esterase/lipase